MNDSVIKRIESVLTSGYSVQNFVEFVQEVFDNVKLVAPDHFRKEFTNFSSHIAGSSHVGEYTTPDGKKIVIFAVQLLNQGYVENSRSTQRSYAKKLIEASGSDAALIAFYTEGDPKWRLSFVRLDYEMKIENGKLKTAENITPAKRYSYLVGEGEPCHTAIERFRRFITDNHFHPTLEEFEEAFSVEAVTNEFFTLYCEKFHQLREHLEASEDFKIESERHNFTAAQFAKKLMGQIVFLYFLQKKGWLGVNAWPKTMTEKEYKNAFFAKGAKSRELIPLVYQQKQDGLFHLSAKGLEQLSDEDEAMLAPCVKGEPWGTGPHNFMRRLFTFSQKKNANFFDDYLEPLFYNALNVNRGDQGYDPVLHCRIPFLSGGLFEPIDGYEWEHNDFGIPNEIFSNGDTRTGTGILDVFDRYNFTMSEDEPLEREVAIDPEMLGKVFENLLEVKDRKSKGAFYTPREIVHYMCQESLINYLTESLKVSEDAVRDFILYGDFMKDEDTVKDKRLGNAGMYISEELYKIDASGKVVVNRLMDMDQALANVRVADPAVGSGAFPLGMLNEIVRARQNISAYMAITMNSRDIRMMYQMDRSPHSLKYQTIKNCIFAADIEPSAVDIAQLRLWLALVIDDETNPNAQSLMDGHINPLPLPNLESNILCGNSLIDEFEGIALINPGNLLGKSDQMAQLDFSSARFDAILNRLIEKQDELFRCDNTEKKHQLKDEIESLRDMIIQEQLTSCSAEIRQHYEETKHMASKPYILWQLDFARVFREKGGFDIVVGNPPYIQLQKEINEETHEKLGDQYEEKGFRTYAKTGDIYCLFYEKGYRLLRNGGVLSFITSSKWMRASYGERLRDFLIKETNPIYLIDFAGQKVFASATVDVNILIFTKGHNQHRTITCNAKESDLSSLGTFISQHSSQFAYDSSDGWTILSDIEQSIKEKINSIGCPLKNWNVDIYRGALTGCNVAFLVSGKIRDELISKDPKSTEILLPILRGRDIKRYEFSFSNLWMIATFPSKQYNIDDYPAVRDYLLSFGKERLEQTGEKHTIDGIEIKSRKKTKNKWFETQDSINYWKSLSKQKLVWGEISDKPKFAIDLDGKFSVEATAFLMVGEHLKYLLCFLNSALSEYFFAKYGTTTGMGTLRWKKYMVELLPVPVVSDAIERSLIGILDQLLAASPSEKPAYIEQIDSVVYDIFGFTADEIEFIEDAIAHGAH